MPPAAVSPRTKLLIALCGACMLVSQYIAAREIGSTFFSTELVTIAAAIVALLGPSLGYFFCTRLSDRIVKVWAVCSFMLQLALPFAIRYAVGALSAAGLELGALSAVLILCSLLLCSTFALFLPRLVGNHVSFVQCYSLELCGAIAGMAVLLLTPWWRALIACYWLMGAIVLHLAFQNRTLTKVAVLAAVLMTYAFPAFEAIAARTYYAGYDHIANPVVLQTRYSPYERVDVVQTDSEHRGLYLDGVPFFEQGTLSWFNIYLSQIPGSLIQKRGSALVVGSGSFSCASYLKHLGYDVTVCELDPAVAELGFRWFRAVHQLKPNDVKLVIDDARHFLSATKTKYDIIVMDVPAPYHLQTAMLHTPQFYRQLSDHLAPDGVACLSLCGSPLNSEIAGPIASSAAHVFQDLVAVHGMSCAVMVMYASNEKLPFTAQDVVAAARQLDPNGVTLADRNDIRRLAKFTAPVSEDNLAVVLALSRERWPR